MLMPPPCCRFDDHGQSRQLPERARDGSSPETSQAATTQMAALRELLLTHISKPHLQPLQMLLAQHVSTELSAAHVFLANSLARPWRRCHPTQLPLACLST